VLNAQGKTGKAEKATEESRRLLDAAEAEERERQRRI
jgi:hypothetical protein